MRLEKIDSKRITVTTSGNTGSGQSGQRCCELVCGDAFAAGGRSEALLADATVVFCNCISWPPELKQALSERVRAAVRISVLQPKYALTATACIWFWCVCEGV